MAYHGTIGHAALKQMRASRRFEPQATANLTLPIPVAKWVPQLEPGHRLPATPPPPPPRREARNELKPPAAFRIPVGTVQLRHLRAAAIGDLHPDKTVPRP